MKAWSGIPTPVEYLQSRSPLELQGALVIQAKQCRNCHWLGGSGGQRGPALDGVATRLTRDQLVRQVIQGGGNMPAYGKNLCPAEVDCVGCFHGDCCGRAESNCRPRAAASTAHRQSMNGLAAAALESLEI